MSFNYLIPSPKTYRGHGTDLALVAGILGMDTDDPEIPNSLEIAHKRGIKIVWTIQKDSNAPPPKYYENHC